MESRNKTSVPARKLIQARLPFKRLNPIPKEKLDTDSDVKKARNTQNVLDQNILCPALSQALPDNVENSCKEETETQLIPKHVNCKGPLDDFVQKSTKYEANQPLLLKDFMRDPHHRRNDNTGCAKPNDRAASLAETQNMMEGESGSQNFTCITQIEPRLETCLAEADKELSNTMSDEKETNITKEDKSENVLFEEKMPVVVLDDILVRSQAVSLERSLPSLNETMESCPEEDTPGTNSSLSTLSLTSSPETLATQEHENDASPLAASTPVWKPSQKTHWSSEEKEKLRLQRDQERVDKLQKLQAEREERERLKTEARAAKERAREEAKRKKEEEKELKEKERREKKEKDEKEKAEKQRAKEEKRKERQEALEAKLEEKRKKEEEKRLKEEEKRIKAEKAEITRFFQKPKSQPVPKILAGWCGKFAPFEIKENMVLAPLCRVAIDQDLPDRLEQFMQEQSYSASFLDDLKSRDPWKSGPTLACIHIADGINSDVVIVSSSQAEDVPERKKFGRMKLMQFCENHRPAYWGTWNKKSSAISPRNPWAKDVNLLDYDVESDEEWEEEEPGESLSHSEGDDEDDGEEEDDDDGFFVPHGYLSEDEGVTEECDPENHKARQKLKAKEWDELIAKGKRFRILQPVKIGCLWGSKEDGGSPSPEMGLLQQFAACVLDSSFAEEEPTEKSSKRATNDQQILGQLLPLLHGNVNGSKVIIREFQECCRLGLLLGHTLGGGEMSPSVPEGQTPASESTVPSKARLKRIISENSVYEKRPEYRMCWYVHSEVLKSYGQEHLPVPCQWNYITQVPSVAKEEGGSAPGAGAAPSPPVSVKRKSTGSMSITKFMRRPPGTEQVENLETQADTEEEDDDDCIIVEMQQSKAPEPHTLEQAAADAIDLPGGF